MNREDTNRRGRNRNQVGREDRRVAGPRQEAFRGPEARGSRAGGGSKTNGLGRGGEGRGMEGFGGGEFGGRPMEAGFGRGRGRMFRSGGVKLAVLKLLSEQPAHGYQLIKLMEQRLAGGYTPSAGAIYPTLSLLEDEGLIEVSFQDNRKMYSVTAEGTSFLEANKAQVEAIFANLEEAGRSFARGRSPELMRAFGNLRGAVTARMARGNATEATIKKMVESIDAAAKAIDEI